MKRRTLKKVRKVVVWNVIIGSILFLSSGCEQKNTFVPPPPPMVTVEKPLQQKITEYVTFTGITQAYETVEIRARVEGYLQSIHFADSSEVKKGDLLFVIDPKPFQARLDEAASDLAIRKADLKLAETTLKRRENAFKDKAVSEVEVIEARARRDMATAAVKAARSSVETARLNLSYTKIHAPVSGRIGRNLVDVGNLVGADESTLLGVIVNDDPMYVYFNIGERDLMHYREMERNLENDGVNNEAPHAYLGLSDQKDYPVAGRLDYKDNRLDSATGTIQIRGVFPNPDHMLLSGQFARIQIPVRNNVDALLVSNRALGTDQQGPYLFVVNDQNQVEYRAVETGALINGMRVIRTGINPEDRVIVDGIQRARPGIMVTPIDPETPQSAPAANQAQTP